jgi:esterase
VVYRDRLNLHKKVEMNLHFRKIGEGPAVVFLHGVFGSSDNLFTVSKQIAEAGYTVYTPDARNHGMSPRSEVFDYEHMAQDLNDFLENESIIKPVIMGHSMGGKTVLQFSQHFDNYAKLIIVDIAPKFYPTHHDHIINGLRAIDLNKIESRKDAEEIFGNYVSDFGEKQFILKNLYRTPEGGFDWRINVPVISKNIYLIGEEITLEKTIGVPTLILRGGQSSYVTEEDLQEIKNKYPLANLKTLKEANHWVHATAPVAFVDTVLQFCRS